MLEPVRQYASEKLEQSAEVEEVRRSLAQFFLELAEEVQPQLRGPDQSQWAERLERESDNLRAVFFLGLG
jgi:predicted ATPase